MTLDAHTGRVTLSGTRRDADETQMAGAIVQALRTAGKPLTEAELEDLVDGRTLLKRAVLRQLTSREQVSRLGKGGKGNPYRYTVPVPCSLVPTTCWEQENKNLHSHVSPETQKEFACSRVPEQERDLVELAEHEQTPTANADKTGKVGKGGHDGDGYHF